MWFLWVNYLLTAFKNELQLLSSLYSSNGDCCSSHWKSIYLFIPDLQFPSFPFPSESLLQKNFRKCYFSNKFTIHLQTVIFTTSIKVIINLEHFSWHDPGCFDTWGCKIYFPSLCYTSGWEFLSVSFAFALFFDILVVKEEQTKCRIWYASAINSQRVTADIPTHSPSCPPGSNNKVSCQWSRSGPMVQHYFHGITISNIRGLFKTSDGVFKFLSRGFKQASDVWLDHRSTASTETKIGEC